MAMLTTLMVYEKTQPRGRRVVPVAGTTLFATALMIAVYSA